MNRIYINNFIITIPQDDDMLSNNNGDNLSIEQYDYLIAKDRSINNISKCYKRLKEDQTLDIFVLKINDNILYINAGYELNKIWNIMESSHKYLWEKLNLSIYKQKE